MKTNYFTERNDALDYLLDKYQVQATGWFTGDGKFEIASKEAALLP
jgi:hypothetical protein